MIELTAPFKKGGSANKIKTSSSHHRPVNIVSDLKHAKPSCNGSRTRSKSSSLSSHSTSSTFKLKYSTSPHYCKSRSRSCDSCLPDSTKKPYLRTTKSSYHQRSHTRSRSKSLHDKSLQITKYEHNHSFGTIKRKRISFSTSSDSSYKSNKKIRQRCYKPSKSSPPGSIQSLSENQKQISAPRSVSKNSKEFSTKSITRSYQQRVRRGNSIIETQQSVTTIKSSYDDELNSFPNVLKTTSSTASCARIIDNPCNKLDLRVYNSKNQEITKTRPSNDLNHPLYIHPYHAGLYSVRIKNGMIRPVQAINELCVKCKWNLPLDVYVYENRLFKCMMTINNCRFITGQAAHQKKLAKTGLAKLILQWLEIMNIS